MTKKWHVTYLCQNIFIRLISIKILKDYSVVDYKMKAHKKEIKDNIHYKYMFLVRRQLYLACKIIRKKLA